MDAAAARELTRFAVEANEHVLGTDGAAWTARFRERFEELAAAADMLLASGDVDGALELAGSLSRAAQAAGTIVEARSLAERVLDGVDGAGRGPARAPAELVVGELAFRQGNQAAAQRATSAALAGAEAAGDAVLAERAHMNLSRIAFRDGDAPRIAEHAERMLELNGDDPAARAGAVHMLGWAAYTAGDVDGAIARFAENVRNHRAAGNEVGVASELANIGELSLETGDVGRAAAVLAESLELAERLGSMYLLPSLLGSAALVCEARGEFARCLELAAASDAQYEAAGLTPDPGGGLPVERRRAAAAAVGADEAASLAGRGAALTLGDAVALARSALSAA